MLGHNGAGKSTTFACISGFTKPTKGNIRICGYDIKENLTECQRQLGYCPQFNPLFAKLTVRDHLWFYGNLKLDQTSGVTDEEINEVIRQIGLKGEDNKVRRKVVAIYK